MAKYDVEYACGHKWEIQLFGPIEGRLVKLDYEAEKLCPDCYKAKIETKHAAESAKAAEEAKQAGLPALQGSEKQIAWAESIRAKQMPALLKLAADLDNAPESANQDAVRIGKEIVSRAINCTSAKDWIDARDRVPSFYWLNVEVKAAMAKTKTAESTG